MRADLTRLLIEERGFAAVVVEADFPGGAAPAALQPLPVLSCAARTLRLFTALRFAPPLHADAFRANLWVRGLCDDGSAEQALRDFVRFPTWWACRGGSCSGRRLGSGWWWLGGGWCSSRRSGSCKRAARPPPQHRLLPLRPALPQDVAQQRGG